MRARRLAARLLVVGACAVAIGCSNDPDQLFYELGRSDGLTPLQLRGRDLYYRHCVGCHGEKGDGQGLAAPFLDPRPRDFTRGIYKFRSTPTASLPTDSDLLRTLREGVHGTSMPSWRLVPDDELRSVIAFVKTFSTRFVKNAPMPAISLPGAPADIRSPERIDRGKKVYADLQCGKCHGDSGKGDGPSSATLTDSEDHPIRPFDFTKLTPKGGARPEDLYRTFMTGLAGTPMPDYSEMTSDDSQRWDLVAFVLSLRASANGAGSANQENR
jgi:mono/diheme cytochrome c family protein